MSYILEALRRSQAERERGQVPGLHAQPTAVAALPTPQEGLPWRWLGPVLVAVVAALAWALWAWRQAPATPAVAGVPVPAPVPVAQPSPPPLPVVVSVPPVPTPAPVPAPVVAPAPTPAPPPAAAAAPAAPRTVRLAELSAEQRRELPPLSMGGSVWSESAISRFVIINGQVVREGDTAAPGVVVDRIGPKTVLLRWRDLRLEVPI